MGFRNRTFGVELEFYGPEFSSEYGLEARSDSYQSGIGVVSWHLVNYAGIPLKGTYKNGGWVLADEYLRDRASRGQFELSSAVLQGVKGMRQLRGAVDTLNELDCMVDEACGLHVHVDVKDLTAYEIAAVVARYTALEDKIDNLVHPTRRGNKNRFCVSSKPALPKIVWEAAKATDTKRGKNQWVSKLDTYSVPGGRQVKLNVLSVYEHGTIEFRHHEGTLDPDRIEAWVKFCINFVEQTKRELKGYRVRRNRIPALTGDPGDSWIITNRIQNYPQDVSYAFPKWNRSPLTGLQGPTRKLLSA